VEEVTLDAVVEAAERIRGHVIRTPVLTCRSGEAELFCKAESLQPTGAFKLRGAFNKMKTLPVGCPGVVAHSSGNHAQAVARAARVLGLPAVIVMPDDAPAKKRARAVADGAEVVLVSPDSDERVRATERLAEERGFALVPPYDDPLVAAGQGTAALELLEDAPVLDRFYAPISGGGLMAGCAVVVASRSPSTEIIGAEPSSAERARRSLAAGEIVGIPTPDTLADGLRVRRLGATTWPIISRHVTRVETVSEAEMLDAMAFALDAMRVVLEPSGACALALALREGRGSCGVVLSGGNVDADLLARVVSRSGDASESVGFVR
jgi:threonine dehydratase